MTMRRTLLSTVLALSLSAIVVAQTMAPARADGEQGAQPPASIGRVDTSAPPVASSGFWTSRAPAKGGAYRYPLLILGVVVATATAGLLVIGLRRVGRARND